MVDGLSVKDFRLLTSCMPSARDPFTRVHIGPNRLRLLSFQFISVHRNSLQFKSTAEVNPLRAVQGVSLAIGNWQLAIGNAWRGGSRRVSDTNNPRYLEANLGE